MGSLSKALLLPLLRPAPSHVLRNRSISSAGHLRLDGIRKASARDLFSRNSTHSETALRKLFCPPPAAQAPSVLDSKVTLEERVAPRHQRPAAGVWHLWPHQPSEWQRSDG
jgi:hypothetical protein